MLRTAKPGIPVQAGRHGGRSKLRKALGRIALRPYWPIRPDMDLLDVTDHALLQKLDIAAMSAA